MVVRPLKIVQLAIAQFPGPSTRGESQNDFEQLPSLCFNRDIEFLSYYCIFVPVVCSTWEISASQMLNPKTEYLFFKEVMDALRSRSNATQTLLWRDIWDDEDVSQNLICDNLQLKSYNPHPFNSWKSLNFFLVLQVFPRLLSGFPKNFGNPYRKKPSPGNAL